MAIVVIFGLAQSDHIKQLLLYFCCAWREPTEFDVCLFFLVPSVVLQCHQCSSDTDANCADPFYTDDTRCQFHQHFTSSFFVQKCFAKLLWDYSLGTYFLAKGNQHKSCLYNVCEIDYRTVLKTTVYLKDCTKMANGTSYTSCEKIQMSYNTSVSTRYPNHLISELILHSICISY